MQSIKNNVVLREVVKLAKIYPVGFISHAWILFMRGLSSFLPQLFISQIIDGIAKYDYMGDPFSFVRMPFISLMAFTIALTVSFRVWHYLYYYKTCPLMLQKLKADAVQTILEKAPRFFYLYPGGYISTRINQFTSGIESFIEKVTSSAIPNFLNMVVPVIFMFSISPKIGAASCVSLVVMFGGLWVSMRKLEVYGYKYYESSSRADGTIVDTIMNIWTIKFFNAKLKQYRKIKNALKDILVFRQKISMIWLMMFVVANDIFGILIFGVSSFFAFQELAANRISIASFTFILLQVIKMANDAWMVLFSIPELIRHYQEARYAIDVINEPMTLPEKKDAKTLNLVGGEVVLDSVNFHYDEKEPLFRDFSLKIEKGQHVGLVGKSGSGKTSLVNLVLRLYDVESGSVKLDGQDVRDVTLESIYDNIVVIPQNPMLLDCSIEENIRYGDFDASDEEVIAAAKKAYIHDFIAELPEGYKTNATGLSGGQKQRVSIARAMLKVAAKNPKLVVIDEGTSQIDSITEALIQSSFEEMIKGRTAIVIAHRLSTIKNMKRLLIFDKQGCVVEDGTPAELEALDGHYAKLKRTQGMIIGAPDV